MAKGKLALVILFQVDRRFWDIFLPTGAGRSMLGLLSTALASELRVASGLATGAVDRSLASPVQRRVNCSVGP